MKKYLIVIMVLLASQILSQTYDTVFIAPSGFSPTPDYNTLASAETGEQATKDDLVNDMRHLVFVIQGGSWDDQPATTIDGYNSNTTYFLTVVAIDDAKAGGSWDGTDAYRLSASFRPFYINDDFVVIDGLQVEVTGTGDFRVCIEPDGAGEVIKNCILLHTNTGTDGRAIGRGSGTAAEYYYNNIAIEPDGHIGIAFTSSANDCNAYIINNTIIGFTVGVSIIDFDAVVRNNIFWGTRVPIDANTVCGVSPYSHHNATDSLSISYAGCGSCGTGDILGMSDPFVNSGAGNYLLAGGSDPIDAGSDESSVLGESIGILGNTRTTWDIGADESDGDEETTPVKQLGKVHLGDVKL